jgi:hypothetical protein
LRGSSGVAINCLIASKTTELLVVFFLERFDLAGEIAICIHEAAELHERPHNGDIDFDSASAAEDAGEHGNALLGESVGWPTSASVRS